MQSVQDNLSNTPRTGVARSSWRNLADGAAAVKTWSAQSLNADAIFGTGMAAVRIKVMMPSYVDGDEISSIFVNC